LALREGIKASKLRVENRYEEAIVLLEKSIQRRRPDPSDLRQTRMLFPSMMEMVVLNLMCGRYSGSEKYLSQLIASIEHWIEELQQEKDKSQFNEKLLAARYTLSGLYHDLGGTLHHIKEKREECQTAYLKALDLYRLVSYEKDERWGTYAGNLAFFYETIGNYKEATKWNIESLKAIKYIERWDHPHFASSLHRYHINIPIPAEQLDDWKANGLAVVSHMSKTLGSTHPAIASPLFLLSCVFKRQERYDLAQHSLERALHTYKITYGEFSTFTANVYIHLGLLAQHLKDFTEAEKYFKEAYRIKGALLGDDHLHVGLVGYELAKTLMLQGKPHDGIFYLKNASEVLGHSLKCGDKFADHTQEVLRNIAIRGEESFTQRYIVHD